MLNGKQNHLVNTDVKFDKTFFEDITSSNFKVTYKLVGDPDQEQGIKSFDF